MEKNYQTTNVENKNNQEGTYCYVNKRVRNFRDNIAIVMMVIISGIAAASIFGLVSAFVASICTKLEYYLAVMMIVGLIILSIFGYCMEYIKVRIKKH